MEMYKYQQICLLTFAFYIFISVKEAKASLIQIQGHFTSVKKCKGGSLQHSQMDFHSLGVYSFESLSQNFGPSLGIKHCSI